MNNGKYEYVRLLPSRLFLYLTVHALHNNLFEREVNNSYEDKFFFCVATLLKNKTAPQNKRVVHFSYYINCHILMA